MPRRIRLKYYNILYCISRVFYKYFIRFHKNKKYIFRFAFGIRIICVYCWDTYSVREFVHYANLYFPRASRLDLHGEGGMCVIISIFRMTLI